MNTIPLLTTCSILLLSSQAFSQDSVATGGGDNGEGGMGSISINVPAEGEDDNHHPDGNNDNNDPIPNPSGSDNPDCSDEAELPASESVPIGAWKYPYAVTPKDAVNSIPIFDVAKYISKWSETAVPVIEYKIPREGKNDNTPAGSSTDDKGSDWSVPVNERRIPNVGKRENRPVDPVEKFRNRINTQDKVNSGTRPRIVLRGDDVPSCPNRDGGSTNAQDTPRDTTQYPTCDCCCHDSSSRLRELFESSDSWNDDPDSSYSQSDCGKSNPNRYGDNDRDKDDDSQDNGDDNSPEQSFIHDDDDCDCSCTCRKPFGIAMYD